MAPAVQPTAIAKQRSKTGTDPHSRCSLGFEGERKQFVETRAIARDRCRHSPLYEPCTDRVPDSQLRKLNSPVSQLTGHANQDTIRRSANA